MKMTYYSFNKYVNNKQMITIMMITLSSSTVLTTLWLVVKSVMSKRSNKNKGFVYILYFFGGNLQTNADGKISNVLLK